MYGTIVAYLRLGLVTEQKIPQKYLHSRSQTQKLAIATHHGVEQKITTCAAESSLCWYLAKVFLHQQHLVLSNEIVIFGY